MSPVARKKPASTRFAASASILVIHGPNLNLLGVREPGIYGSDTLDAINARLVAQAKAANVGLSTFQSNHEGAIVDRIQAARTGGVGFIVLNPAAFTHTSVAIRDALAGVAIPFVEVHISNVHAREAWRHHSYFSDKAVGTIVGLGPKGYEFAVAFALARLEA
jgi:3-dehydroquinate dehydratase-2